jgi:Rad3-related DNA helicase
LRISELYDDGYLTYITEGHKKEMLYKLFCIHPATKLRRFLMNSRSAIFFSATLSPMPYYRDLLCKDEDIKLLDLPSPFDPDNRLLLYASDVPVKYKDRENSLSKICGYIDEMASAKTGNYMVFFPSYQYMNNAFMLFEALHGERFNLVRQTRDLSDSDKVDFLGAFETHLTGASGISMISFVVMGGHFSEGIDLQGDLLIGAMVVGVGLPMIAFENNLIKNYFDDISGRGFEFAYQFPGINKVMQSAGRVIRGSDDRGVVVLVDQRYSTGHYRRFFPKDWGKTFTSEELFKGQLDGFWKNI